MENVSAVRAPARFCWHVSLGYSAFYLACLAIPFYGVSWRAVGLMAASFFFRMFFLSVGYHRYFSHRAFQTSRPVQFLLGLFGALTVQRGPLWWAQTHRHHHRHADTTDDLHSPRHMGFWRSHFGWFMSERYARTDYSKIRDFARYPELRLLDSEARNVLYLGYAGLFYWLGGMQGLLWGFFLSTVLLWNISHWIQSLSHMAVGGYRRYQSKDHSRNHYLIGLLSLGEWHNNHHYSPSTAKQGHVWWEIDVGYYFLAIGSRLGLVWDLQPLRRPREA